MCLHASAGLRPARPCSCGCLDAAASVPYACMPCSRACLHTYCVHAVSWIQAERILERVRKSPDFLEEAQVRCCLTSGKHQATWRLAQRPCACADYCRRWAGSIKGGTRPSMHPGVFRATCLVCLLQAFIPLQNQSALRCRRPSRCLSGRAWRQMFMCGAG